MLRSKERKSVSITNAELNTLLYRKMFAEQERYRQRLLAMTPEEILRSAYEFTIKEDIERRIPVTTLMSSPPIKGRIRLMYNSRFIIEHSLLYLTVYQSKGDKSIEIIHFISYN